MTQKILILVPLEAAVLLICAFSIFSAFHYCDDDLPSKLFLIVTGIIGMLVAAICAVGIVTL